MMRMRKLLNRGMLLMTLLTMLIGLTVAAQPVATATTPAALDESVVEQYFGKVLSGGNMAVADTILSPAFSHIDRSAHGATLGASGTKFMIEYQRRALPDLRYTIDAVVFEGDLAAVCWTASGTHAAAFGTAEATGHTVTWTGMSFVRVQDGKIVQELTNLENVGELLGAGPMRISPSYGE